MLLPTRSLWLYLPTYGHTYYGRLRVPLAGYSEEVGGEGLEHVGARQGGEGAARVGQQQHDALPEGVALAVEEEARLQP